jgi:Flp pilus assembly protein TadD
VSAPPAVAVPAPAASPYPTSPPQAAAGATLAQPEPVADRGALDACQDAYGRGRRKQVLSACAQAFADNPKSAEIAVMLAKTELDRGRARQALDWAKQAVALDEKQADAYVILGGAQQAIGHPAAAKFAYQRYLQLAPKGRYAADLRAVLGSL